MIIGHRVSTRLLQNTTYSFAGLPFGKKRDKAKNDLDKYNVVIVGGHLGALLSNHLDSVVQDKAKIFVAWDNPVYQFHPNRPFYEKGRYTPQ